MLLNSGVAAGDFCANKAGVQDLEDFDEDGCALIVHRKADSDHRW